MSQTDFHYQKKELPASLTKFALILLSIGVVLSLIAFFVDRERALFGYLVTYMMIVSIAIGSLFMVALEYIAGQIGYADKKNTGILFKAFALFIYSGNSASYI